MVMSVNNLKKSPDNTENLTVLKNSEKAKEIWEKCLEVIRPNLNALAFKTWFSPIVPVDFENNTLKVKIPYDFSWEYIEMHYNHLIKKALLNVIGENAKLSYKFENSEDIGNYLVDQYNNKPENEEIDNLQSKPIEIFSNNNGKHKILFEISSEIGILI